VTIEIRMPQLAADMTEADLLDWLVAPGDKVEAGDVILELETDKSTVELEAPAGGILTEIRVAAGTQGVPVGEVLGVLEAAEGVADAPAEDLAPEATEVAEPLAASEPPANAEPPGDSAPATALARRVAEQSGVALDGVSGTGARGRITRGDVERSLGGPVTPTAAGRSIPHSRMRRTIAARLTAAKQNVPHFYLHVDCDASSAYEARSVVNAGRSDAPISLNDFVIRASALALAEVPAANATWTDDAVILHPTIDVSVAVAIEGGLVTPIVRDADRKGLAAIADEMRDLAARARAGRLVPAEYQGGGFTVSNLGMYGVDSVYPIVNPPQSCILGVGAASERPVVRGGALAVGRVMTLTLCADHRAVDGAVGAQLLAAIRRRLEAPLDMML
jgi:pyruvate dehydrogenase E2 component (dihydrolipoamide acetyltransferase)